MVVTKPKAKRVGKAKAKAKAKAKTTKGKAKVRPVVKATPVKTTVRETSNMFSDPWGEEIPVANEAWLGSIGATYEKDAFLSILGKKIPWPSTSIELFVVKDYTAEDFLRLKNTARARRMTEWKSRTKVELVKHLTKWDKVMANKTKSLAAKGKPAEDTTNIVSIKHMLLSNNSDISKESFLQDCMVVDLKAAANILGLDPNKNKKPLIKALVNSVKTKSLAAKVEKAEIDKDPNLSIVMDKMTRPASSSSSNFSITLEKYNVVTLKEVAKRLGLDPNKNKKPLIASLVAYKFIEDNIEPMVLTIGDTCIETYPCHHEVFINGVSQGEWNADKIRKWFVNHGEPIPEHFQVDEIEPVTPKIKNAVKKTVKPKPVVKKTKAGSSAPKITKPVKSKQGERMHYLLVEDSYYMTIQLFTEIVEATGKSEVELVFVRNNSESDVDHPVSPLFPETEAGAAERGIEILEEHGYDSDGTLFGFRAKTVEDMIPIFNIFGTVFDRTKGVREDEYQIGIYNVSTEHVEEKKKLSRLRSKSTKVAPKTKVSEKRTNAEILLAPLHDVRSMYYPDYIIIGNYSLLEGKNVNEGWLHVDEKKIKEIKTNITGLELAFVDSYRDYEWEKTQTYQGQPLHPDMDKSKEISMLIENPDDEEHLRVKQAFDKIRSSEKFQIRDFRSEIIGFKNEDRGMTHVLMLMNILAKGFEKHIGHGAPAAMHTFDVNTNPNDDPNELEQGASVYHNILFLSYNH
jgi:hypothetical protein